MVEGREKRKRGRCHVERQGEVNEKMGDEQGRMRRGEKKKTGVEEEEEPYILTKLSRPLTFTVFIMLAIHS